MATQAAIMDKQREIADKQAANLERQLSDSEATEIASLAIEDFKITVLQPFPDLKFKIESCTIRNIGNSVADEINFALGGAGGTEVGYPEPDFRDKFLLTPIPYKNGPSLAQGRDRPCPIVGRIGEQNSAGATDPQFAGEWLSVSYVDIFKQPHITSDCLIIYSSGPTEFRPCERGYQHQ